MEQTLTGKRLGEIRRRRDRYQRQRATREHHRLQRNVSIIADLRFTPRASKAPPTLPRIMYCNRVTDGSDLQLVKNDSEVNYKDPIFNDYKRIDGRQSALIYVVDKSTKDPFLVVNVVLFKDMTNSQRYDYSFLFGYIKTDEKFRCANALKNGAMVRGTMKATGYRAATEKDMSFGEYAPTQQVQKRLQTDPEFTAEFWRHLDKAKGLHQILSKMLYGLAPKLHEELVMEMRRRRLPPLGAKHHDIESEDEEVTESSPFTPHLIYTYNGFTNKPHCDNDVNLWATGIWGPCDTSGKLVTHADGFNQQGHYFFNASYKVLVDTGAIDGIVHMAWRGREDIHATSTGHLAKGYQRWAFTAQMNKQLDQRVSKALKTGVLNVMDTERRIGSRIK